MKKYNKSELIKWIQVCSIHPSNQIYQGRFELLLGIALSVRDKDYKRDKIEFDKFKSFIKEFKTNTDRFFIEDFIPYNQLNLIPYFIDGNKFFFFYGLLENAYELLRVLEKVYLFDYSEKIPELDLIKEIFIKILKIDTEILLKLNADTESHNTSKDSIYIPSEDYFHSFITLFDVKTSELLTPDYFQEYIEKEFIVENISKFTHGGFFNNIYIQTLDGEVILLLPQLHIEILSSVFVDIVQKAPNLYYIKEQINNNFKKQVLKASNKFFKNLLFKITDTKNLSLSRNIDGIFLFENKLLVFQIPLIFPESNLSEEINNSYTILEEFKNNIGKQEIIHLKFHQKYFHKVQIVELDIIKFIIFEKIDINPVSLFLNIDTNLKYNVFSFKDLIAMFELVSSPLSFIKYLEERHEYRQKIRTINGLNIFATFIQNNESLPDYGEGFITIMPHTWSNYYYNHLFLKFQDNIYELIESDYPNKFDYVNQLDISQDLYECFSAETLTGAHLIKMNNKLIWIFGAEPHPSLSWDDLRFALSMFGLLYTNYIHRISKDFLNLLQSNNFNQKIRIFLVPSPLFQNSENYIKFRNTYERINEKTPLVVKSFINVEKNLISMVFYNTELWIKKFSDTITNENCKFALKQLLLSIIHTLNEKLTSYEIIQVANEIVETIPIIKKDYFFTPLIARNPRGSDYVSYFQLNLTDFNRVKKEIEYFLRTLGLKQKELSPQESKKLYNQIFEILYSKLEKIISKYDISLLEFAYKQLELVERRRFEQLIEIGMKNLDQITEVDRKRYTEEMKNITNHSVSAKFIIEMILKCGIKGERRMNRIDWSYIQANALYLLSVSERSEFTHTGLIDFQINIKEFHKFDEIQQPGKFDNESYTEKRFDIRLEKAKDIFISLKEQSNRIEKEWIQENIKGKEEDLIRDLEKAFINQFSFSFTNLLRTLSILSSTDLHSEDFNLFPLTIIREAELIVEIKERFLEFLEINQSQGDIITNKELQTILKFITLDFESYSDIKMIIPLKLLKKKERFTISPLIRIDDLIMYGNECCNSSYGIWKHNILSGIFPFEIPVNSKVDIAIKNMHSYDDKMFEVECGEIAKNVLGEDNFILRLKNFQRISISFPTFPPCGEIDLLAINKITKKIFILDSKNYSLRLSPKNIKNEIYRFIESNKSDLVKLAKKEKFVIENLDSFLDYFNILDKKDWKIFKSFIIRQNFPSAHIPEFSTNFIFIENLQNYFES
jgi:hypothetical protein